MWGVNEAIPKMSEVNLSKIMTGLLWLKQCIHGEKYNKTKEFQRIPDVLQRLSRWLSL